MSALKAGEGTASPRSIAVKSYSHPQHLFVRMRVRGKSSAKSAIQFISYSQSQTYRSSKATPCLRSNSRYSSWKVRVRWCSCWLTLRTERGPRLALCQRGRMKVRDCRALGGPEASPWEYVARVSLRHARASRTYRRKIVPAKPEEHIGNSHKLSQIERLLDFASPFSKGRGEGEGLFCCPSPSANQIARKTLSSSRRT
jgi:hypothetical protein